MPIRNKFKLAALVIMSIGILSMQLQAFQPSQNETFIDEKWLIDGSELEARPVEEGPNSMNNQGDPSQEYFFDEALLASLLDMPPAEELNDLMPTMPPEAINEDELTDHQKRLINTYSAHTILKLGAVGGDLLLVRYAIFNRDISINARDMQGWTALYHAAYYGHIEMMEWLLEHGAVMQPHPDSSSILAVAAHTGRLEVIQWLMQRGEDIHAVRSGDKKTLLHTAAYFKQLKLVEWLIEQGLDVNAHTRALNRQGEEVDGQTPLLEAVEAGALEIVHLLAEHGADIHALGSEQENAVYEAARWGHLNIIQWLVEQGVAVDTLNDWEESPLHAAAKNGCADVVEWLLAETGLDARAKNSRGQTPRALAQESLLRWSNDRTRSRFEKVIELLKAAEKRRSFSTDRDWAHKAGLTSLRRNAATVAMAATGAVLASQFHTSK